MFTNREKQRTKRQRLIDMTREAQRQAGALLATHKRGNAQELVKAQLGQLRTEWPGFQQDKAFSGFVGFAEKTLAPLPAPINGLSSRQFTSPTPGTAWPAADGVDLQWFFDELIGGTGKGKGAHIVSDARAMVNLYRQQYPTMPVGQMYQRIIKALAPAYGMSRRDLFAHSSAIGLGPLRFTDQHPLGHLPTVDHDLAQARYIRQAQYEGTKQDPLAELVARGTQPARLSVRDLLPGAGAQPTTINTSMFSGMAGTAQPPAVPKEAKKSKKPLARERELQQEQYLRRLPVEQLVAMRREGVKIDPEIITSAMARDDAARLGESEYAYAQSMPPWVALHSGMPYVSPAYREPVQPSPPPKNLLGGMWNGLLRGGEITGGGLGTYAMSPEEQIARQAHINAKYPPSLQAQTEQQRPVPGGMGGFFHPLTMPATLAETIAESIGQQGIMGILGESKNPVIAAMAGYLGTGNATYITAYYDAFRKQYPGVNPGDPQAVWQAFRQDPSLVDYLDTSANAQAQVQGIIAAITNAATPRIPGQTVSEPSMTAVKNVRQTGFTLPVAQGLKDIGRAELVRAGVNGGEELLGDLTAEAVRARATGEPFTFSSNDAGLSFFGGVFDPTNHILDPLGEHGNGQHRRPQADNGGLLSFSTTTPLDTRYRYAVRAPGVEGVVTGETKDGRLAVTSKDGTEHFVPRKDTIVEGYWPTALTPRYSNRVADWTLPLPGRRYPIKYDAFGTVNPEAFFRIVDKNGPDRGTMEPIFQKYLIQFKRDFPNETVANIYRRAIRAACKEHYHSIPYEWSFPSVFPKEKRRRGSPALHRQQSR